MARGGNGRAVTAINGGVALTLVMLLAVVALVVKPPAPPSIAAFAPTVQKPITLAPEGQSSRSGLGKGVCAAGQNCTPPSAAPRPTLTPGPVRTDVGVPPGIDCKDWGNGVFTQTFDPQSPPCISYWDDKGKGNGGATTRGVTRDEIQLTVSHDVISNTGPDTDFLPYLRRVVQFVNTHYQLYNRRIVLTVNNGPDAHDPSGAHAAAQAALATEAFAALAEVGTDSAFGHELARNKMLSVTMGGATGPSAMSTAFKADAPYSWSYTAPVDVVQRNLAAFVCTSLKGKKARLSTEDKATDRKFKILNAQDEDGTTPPVDPRPLQEGLKSCGIDTGPVVTIKDTDKDGPEKASVITDLRTQGVTTILSLVSCCNVNFENAAAKSGWHPEWVYYGMERQYPTVAYKVTGDGEDTNRFGLAPLNKVIDIRDTPFYQAAPAPGVSEYEANLYYPLALLAAGIQMAGPDLTPHTFAEALHDTVFPNPGAGSGPWYQGEAAFPSDETWMVRDNAVWWPNTRQGPDARREYSLCFVDQGRRWRLGTWKDIEAKINPAGLGGC